MAVEGSAPAVAVEVLLLAGGLFSLFDAVGFTLPNTGLVFETRTVIVALLAGILVTLVAGLRPAIRATRVPPVAAVREGATLPPGRFARLRGVGALLMITAGFGALAYGLFAGGLDTTEILIWMGLGTLLVFLGVALFSSRLVRPLAHVLGWPATRIGGAAGSLARDNARRNPQRTASTAAALMIGLALVTLVATLASGIVASFKGAVNDLFTGDFAITAQNNFSPIPIDAAEATAQVPGVTVVGNVRTGEALRERRRGLHHRGRPRDARGDRPRVERRFSGGHLVARGRRRIRRRRLGGGQRARDGIPIEITFPNGTSRTFTIDGIFEPPTGGSPFASVTISAAAWDAEVAQPRNLYSFLKMEGGPTDWNQAALDTALADFPNAKAQTRQAFIDNQISGLSSILNILYVLLALSIIVSLFGIVNTLVLTVFERTREIGMLRAIGMTRRQIRRMIRHESVITALIGATIGIVLGIVLAALLIARVDFLVFSFPTTQVIIFVIAAIVVGILAAVFPARRAAKLDPLRAIAYE